MSSTISTPSRAGSAPATPTIWCRRPTRALAGLAGFERGTNLRAWLFRILRNAWIDQARRRTIDPTDRGVEVTDEVAPADVGRLRAVEAAEIEAAVTALPDDHREVVLLDLAGLTEREVAAALGVAVGTVKSRLARARAALRRRLLDYAR